MKTKLLILTMILLCSCGSKSTHDNNNSFIKIDLFSEPSSVISNLSDIASNVEYVPLQTSENSMVSTISNVKTNGDIIIVSSFSFSNPELICFDRNGRYLKKLSKYGRGPGEYFVIGDFDINYKANILVLLSNTIIMVYDIIGNEFVFNKSLNYNSTYYNRIDKINFIPGQNNILLSYLSTTFEKFRNLVINLNGDTLDTRLNNYKFTIDPTQGKEQQVLASPYENISYNYNNSLHFRDWFSDTVFTIGQSNSIIPYLRFNSNGKQFNPDDLAKLYVLQHSGGSYPDDYVTVDFIMESPRYIVYNYTYKKATIYELHDKVMNKKIGIRTKPFLEDDITGGLNVEPKLSFNGKLYSWVEAIDLKNHVSSEEFKTSVVKNPKKKQDLETLANTLKETDNPVLVVVTLKN